MINYSKGWTQIELTDYCNLRCIMCEQGGHVSWNPREVEVHQTKKNFLPLNLWKKIITDFSHLGHFWEISPFWLGEATLHPQFAECIEFLSQKGNFSSFQLHTNLNILNQKIINSLKKVFSSFPYSKLFISLDGITQTTYSKIRCGGNLKNVIQNIFEIIKFKNKYHFNFKLVLQFIVMPENVEEAPDFLKFWQNVFNFYKMPYKIVTIKEKNLLFDSQDSVNNYIYFEVLNSEAKEKAKNFALYYETIKKLLDYNHYPLSPSFKNKNKEDVVIHNSDNDEKLLENFKNIGKKLLSPLNRKKTLLEKATSLLQKLYSSSDYVKPCAFIFLAPYINSHGEVTLCCLDNKMDLKQGDLSKNSLVELWESEKMIQIRLKHIFNLFSDIEERCYICISRGQRKQNRDEITLTFSDTVAYLHALCK